ncbi:MAG: HD domain-containing phosphohydrolase [Candidatus Omnitrophota bacterium]|jgi:HD-GYP domain-containing protein (c-di-GMP phosphodiesterase class II)
MPKRKREPQSLHHVKESLKVRIDELTALYEVSRSITSSVDLDNILSLIVKKVAAILKTDICTIHLVNSGDILVKTTYGVKPDASGISKPLPVTKSVVARAIKSKKPIRLDDVCKNRNDIFCKIVRKHDMRSLLVVPLIKNEKSIGTLTCCSSRPMAYSKDDERELSLFASQAAVAIENARLFEEIKVNYLNTMKLLASVIDAKDTYTEHHSESVVELALGAAVELKLPEKMMPIIKYASMLHDIGKIGIDISILRKPAPLNKEEWLEMKKHPKNGAAIIKKAGFLDDLIPAIYYHHVWYGGGGYPPTRKKKDAIPLEARILSVADAYESMTSDRPYRSHLSKEQAVAELNRASGTQFDPKVVKAFLRFLARPKGRQRSV